MKNIVQVKAKHIREAKRLRKEQPDGYRLSRCCPVALAVQDHIGKTAGVSSESIQCWSRNPGMYWPEVEATFKSTKSVIAAVKAFNNRKPLKPFNFKLIPVKA